MRGTPSWPGHDPETGYVGADRSDHSQKLLADGAGHTFLNTIAGALGDYHRTAPIETFAASTGERHPTDLAGLRGARLVTATETEEGRRLAEARVKALTGGDRISARFMRQDFFEFQPQFKLFIAGNHRPRLRSVDEAIRRRFNLIPFTVAIPPGERNKELAEQLKAEWSGVLAWMVEGCLEWQRSGLLPPTIVIEATADYLNSEDSISAWLDDCCIRDPTALEPSAALFASWKGWAEQNSEFVGSMKSLSQTLQDRGFERRRDRKGSGFLGLMLKRDRGDGSQEQDQVKRP